VIFDALAASARVRHAQRSSRRRYRSAVRLLAIIVAAVIAALGLVVGAIIVVSSDSEVQKRCGPRTQADAAAIRPRHAGGMAWAAIQRVALPQRAVRHIPESTTGSRLHATRAVARDTRST